MIPYIKIPTLTIWKLEFHAFGILVGIAILVGAYVLAERSDKVGLSRQHANDLVLWMLGFGFVFAHLIAVFFYHYDRFQEDPWVILEVWNGISSVGGFLGGVIGFFVYTARHKLPRMPYADVSAYALSFGWIFGRMGCATAHDHPGRLTDFPLAVAFPDGPRHDLGLYELVVTLVIAAIMYATRDKATRAAPGLHIGLLATIYGPVRFFLDFLRATDLGTRSDPRFWGLTAAQYGSIIIFVAGLGVLWWRRSQPPWPEYLAKAGATDHQGE